MGWNLVDVHLNRYEYLYYRITLVSIDIQVTGWFQQSTLSEREIQLVHFLKYIS